MKDDPMDIVERLRSPTGPAFLEQAADEIERLRGGAGYELLADTLVKRDAEIERLRAGQDWQRGEIERLRNENRMLELELEEAVRRIEALTTRKD
jgi:hypothetical protein